MKPQTYSYEDRLVKFAGDTVLFCRTLKNQKSDIYYADQILRASGSAALHYGEAQGTNTSKDFIHKMANVIKELKETRVGIKILNYLNAGNQQHRFLLLKESDELIAIGAKMILNAKQKAKNSKYSS